MVIYKITCLVNNKLYIGQTSRDIIVRFKEHIGCAIRNKKFLIYDAMRKYGTENFIIEEIDGANCLSELNYKETHWIHLYDSVKNGYNLNYGGNYKKQTPETIKKNIESCKNSELCQQNLKNMAIKNIGNKHALGHRHTEEFKKQQSIKNKHNTYAAGVIWTEERRQAAKNREVTLETRQKMSISGKNKPPKSIETRRKIGEPQKGAKNHQAKAVIRNDGKVYGCSSDAARDMKCDNTTILNANMDHRSYKRPFKGYTFKYIDKE